MKGSLVLLSLLVIATVVLVLGCTGSNNSGSPTTTPVPSTVNSTPAPTVGVVTVLPAGTPAVNASVSDATANISAGINATNSTYIDPSIADITNETDESVPDLG